MMKGKVFNNGIRCFNFSFFFSSFLVSIVPCTLSAIILIVIIVSAFEKLFWNSVKEKSWTVSLELVKEGGTQAHFLL